MLILLLIVSFRKRTFIGCHPNQAFFYTMFVFGCKINTFCQHFKKNKNISLSLFIEHFKFIEAYHILLTICKAESNFITQIVRLRKNNQDFCIYFLAYFNKSSYLCNRNQTNSHRNIRKTSKKSNLKRDKT